MYTEFIQFENFLKLLQTLSKYNLPFTFIFASIYISPHYSQISLTKTIEKKEKIWSKLIFFSFKIILAVWWSYYQINPSKKKTFF